MQITFLCCKMAGFCSTRRWIGLVFEDVFVARGGNMGLHFAATKLYFAATARPWLDEIVGTHREIGGRGLDRISIGSFKARAFDLSKNRHT